MNGDLLATVWLPDMDLNHDKQIQSLLCYRYTIGQAGASSRLAAFPGQSSRQTVRSAGFQTCCIADFQIGRVLMRLDPGQAWKPAIQQARRPALLPPAPLLRFDRRGNAGNLISSINEIFHARVHEHYQGAGR